MNTSGEVADLMVKEGIQITEATAKLVGLGAKNLAAIIIALINDDTKLQGKTNLKQLLKSDKPLCILQIKEEDLGKFNAEAKKYGVLFTAVKDKTNGSEFCDIIAKQDDVTKLNYLMEKLGYAAPEIEPEPEAPQQEKNKEQPSKNQNPRARENQRENKSIEHGDMERTGSGIDRKPSVRKKVEEIRAQQKQAIASKAPERQRTQAHTPPSRKKKQSKQKGRG